MKPAGNVVGVVLILVGCIWVLQGVNILPGSFMTGQMKWAAYGAIAIVVGIAVLLMNRRGA
jgi:uncharacterized membrane protein HdeD (DUF308 family)